MRKRLTELQAERARPVAGKRIELFDGVGGIPGLSLRIGTSGVKSWSLMYRIGGKQRRTSLGRYPLVGLAEARTKARSLLDRAAAGIGPETDPALARRQQRAETVADVAADYLERRVRRKQQRRAADVERMIRSAILPAIGSRPISSITRRDVVDLIDGIADRAPVMANRTQALLGRLFAWAVERETITASPMTGMRPPAPEASRERLLTDDELASVWQAATALGWPFGPITKLLILTGARRAEVAALAWTELDCSKGLWTKPAAKVKNARTQVLPLSSAALDIINRLPRIDGSPYLFPARYGAGHASSFSGIKLKLDELSGVRDWCFHDFRRCIASGLQSMGVALQVTECILGHTAGSRAGVVGIYSRYGYLKEQRDALERWACHVLLLAEGRAGGTVIALHR